MKAKTKTLLNVALIGVLGIIAIMIIQFVIDYAYMRGVEEKLDTNTFFSASESLLYWGSGLAFIGTCIFGYITFTINKKATNISDRMLEFEENKNIPKVDILLLTSSEMDIVLPEREDKKRVMKFGLTSTISVNDPQKGYDPDYSFEIINFSEVYIFKIELIQIVIWKLNNKYEKEKELVNCIQANNLLDANTYLRPNESRGMLIGATLIDSIGYDYMRYELKFHLHSNSGSYEEVLSFNVQNCERFHFINDKSINIEKCN